MIGVAQNDLDIQFFQFPRRHRFHGAAGADRHENRGVDYAMGGFEASEPCSGRRILIQQFKIIHQSTNICSFMVLISSGEEPSAAARANAKSNAAPGPFPVTTPPSVSVRSPV